MRWDDGRIREASEEVATMMVAHRRDIGFDPVSGG